MNIEIRLVGRGQRDGFAVHWHRNRLGRGRGVNNNRPLFFIIASSKT